MKITGLRAQQRKTDRVNVYLDGKYAFSLHAPIAAQLRVGQELSEEECARLQRSDAVQRAYELVLRFLAYRPRSRAEMERYLQRKGIAEEMIPEVLGKVASSGWADDVSFAKFWVDNRQYFRPRSRQALRVELRRKGVDQAIVEDALQGVNEEESAYQAAAPRASKLAHLDRQTFRRRLGGFLQRRGFGYGVIKSTVERLWQEYAGDNARGSSINFGPSTKDQNRVRK